MWSIAVLEGNWLDRSLLDTYLLACGEIVDLLSNLPYINALEQEKFSGILLDE